MPVTPAIEHYFAPTTLDEALALMREGGATVLAGGTDLMPQANAGRVEFQPTLLNIRRVSELAGVSNDGEAIRIGALVSVTELMEDALVRSRLPVLVEAADHFASDQLRNAATVGGNVCNASPAGDLLVPLLVLDAEVELASMHGGAREIRRVPLREFFTGPGRTVRRAAELLAAIRVPRAPEGFVARFCKFGTRPALDISAVSIGIGCARRGGVLRDVRVAFGAVAPVPMRAPRTEAALEGREPTARTFAEAADVAHDEVRPISDVRASEWYRRELIRNLTRRVLNDVAH
jgi:CO/xanthine dehydrogenase FAD-binding subunit